MARKESKFPEENKLVEQMKALRKRAEGRDYSASEEKQMDTWRDELNDMRFRRLATARVNKTLRMVSLLGNLGKLKPSDANIAKIETAFKEVLTDAFTRLRGKAHQKGGFTL